MGNGFKNLDNGRNGSLQSAAEGAGEQPPKKRAPRKRPGGQPGNQNAWKHGLYERAFPPEQRPTLPDLKGVDLLHLEIAVLRLKLDELLAAPQPDMKLILRTMEVMAKLLRIDDRVRFGS